MSRASIILNGKTVQVPRDFFDVGVKASFGEDIQSNLTTDEFTFVLDGYQEIIDWINAGRSGGVGIFEGIPLQISKGDGSGNTTVFNGIVDLQAGVTVQEALRQVNVRLRQDNSLNSLDDLLEPLDYGYLKELGVISSSDYVNVDYVAVKQDQGLETITTLITIALLSKQLGDSFELLSTTIANISKDAANPLTVPNSAIFAVASAIINAAYAAALLILIVDFGVDLFNVLIQPTRTHKGIKLKTLLEKACEYIGYQLQTSIGDLENLVYLPSNNSVDQYGAKALISKVGVIEEGIPNITDPGYTCSELFQIARQLFDARFAISGDTVQFHPENSDYWITQSGWEKPSSMREVASRSFRYNTDEINSSYFITFQTDINDIYTIENFKGTSYQVLTDAKSVGKPENKTIKNLTRVDIPLALGNRKESLNGFEQSLASLANLFDSVASIFGGRPNLAKKIKNKVGVLQVSNNNHTVPKLLWMNGNRLPSNQRNLLSAKTLWDKYHNYNSFVDNGFGKQRVYYENEVVPFGLSSFVQLLNNSYFRDEFGRVGKIVDLEWNMDKDFATLSYWVQQPYTNNLKETFIEP